LNTDQHPITLRSLPPISQSSRAASPAVTTLAIQAPSLSLQASRAGTAPTVAISAVIEADSDGFPDEAAGHDPARAAAGTVASGSGNPVSNIPAASKETRERQRVTAMAVDTFGTALAWFNEIVGLILEPYRDTDLLEVSRPPAEA
jgi:hypothetical protein